MTDERPGGRRGEASPGEAVERQRGRHVHRGAARKDRENFLTGVVVHDLRDRILRHLDGHAGEDVTNYDLAAALDVDVHDVTSALERLRTAGQTSWGVIDATAPSREPILGPVVRMHWVDPDLAP